VTEPRNAQSALNLRLVLASFGLIFALPLAVWAGVAGYLVPAVLLGILAVVAFIDLLVIQYRRRQRRRRERPGTDHSLFE
jgi:Flp pilus assembly protein TadB